MGQKLVHMEMAPQLLSSRFGENRRSATWSQLSHLYISTRIFEVKHHKQIIETSGSENYISSFSIGGFLNFTSNHSKWSKLFPGIRPRLTVIGFNFLCPASRELYLSLGMSSVSANSLIAILKQSNDSSDKSNRDGFTSSAAGLIVGGEREQRLSTPNAYNFVLKNRKGFVRIALKTGASLVPAISFGENNTFEVKKWRFRFNGRVPITTVVGVPIHVQENSSPSEDEVNVVHGRFCEQIRELFEKQKSKYVENCDQVQLEFVWITVKLIFEQLCCDALIIMSCIDWLAF